MAKETENKKAAPKPVKKIELVRVYHQNNSIIDIPLEQVKAHLSAGWRLER